MFSLSSDISKVNETQKYLCELIGTERGTSRSISENINENMDEVSYSRQVSETRKYKVYPHELSTLEDILLLTPYGFCRVNKIQLHNSEAMQSLLAVKKRLVVSGTSVVAPEQKKTPQSIQNAPHDKTYESQTCRIMKSNGATTIHCKASKTTCTNSSIDYNKNTDFRKTNCENNKKSNSFSVKNLNTKINAAMRREIVKCRALTRGYRKHRKN